MKSRGLRKSPTCSYGAIWSVGFCSAPALRQSNTFTPIKSRNLSNQRGTTQMKQQRIYYLDLIRSIAIISITLNHAVSRSYMVYSNQADEFNSIPIGQTILKTFIYTFSRLGVPLFLMLTGALLLSRDYTKNNKFIKHNWLRLFIITEIWLAIVFWYKQFLPGSILFSQGLIGCMIHFAMTLLFLNPISFGNMWYMYMILCVYLMIPFLSVGIKNLGITYFIIPCWIVLFCSFILPDINASFHALAFKGSFKTALESINVFSMYMILVVLGYLLRKRVLAKISTVIIVLLFSVSFILFNIFQLWLFSVQYDYAVGYDSVFPVIASVFLFELIRRKGFLFDNRIVRSCITELSIISFGIFFVHMCIMEGLYFIIKHFNLPIVFFYKLVVLEAISFFGSVAIIEVFKRYKWMSKYLFGIK